VIVPSDPLFHSSNSVEISDRQSLLELDRSEVTSLVLFTLAAESRLGSVEVAFVDDATIADLHLRFMGIPGPTDVITFPLSEDEDPPTEEATLGEVVVSTETALRQGPEYGLDPVDEALLYVVHGVLHLLGYDDLDETDADRMAARQREILEEWKER